MFPSAGQFAGCGATGKLCWLWQPSGSFLQDELSSFPIKLDCKMLFDISGSRIAAEVFAGRKHLSAA